MANPGIVSTQDLSVLFTGVDTAFNNFKFDESTIADKLAYMMTSGQPGQSFQVPFSYGGSAAEVWPLGMVRQTQEPQIFFASGVNQRLAPKDVIEYMATLNWDRYNILSQGLAKYTSRSKRIWDIELAKMINSNPLTFDGVSLFNTAHPANPNQPGLGTYSNDLAATDLDEAGLVAAINTMHQMLWLDGQKLSMPMEDLYLLVPTSALELKARKLIFGTLNPQFGPAAGTSVAASNVLPGLMGMVKGVVLLPELQTGVAATQKQWYLVNASQPSFRPFIVSIVHWPLFHYSGLSPNDEIRRTLGAISYGYEANGAVVAGVPQMVVRATAP